MKNCGKNFHVLVANKEFIQELVKLIGPKYDPPTAVQEKVLSLIQIWADTFNSQPDLKGVVEVYQELRNKGIEFPSIDPDNSVPIYTPQKVSRSEINLRNRFASLHNSRASSLRLPFTSRHRSSGHHTTTLSSCHSTRRRQGRRLIKSPNCSRSSTSSR